MSEARTVDCVKNWREHRAFVVVCGTGKYYRCLEELGYWIRGIDKSGERLKGSICT